MLFKAWKKISGLNAVVHSQWIFIGILCLIILMCGLGWKHAAETQRLYQAPNPSAGGYIDKDTPFNGNVYNFAFNLFAGVNTWNTSGHEDYLKNILSYKNYLSPAFEHQLIADHKTKSTNGALERQRVMTGITGNGYSGDKVESLGNGSWVVYLDMHLVETVAGTTIKDVFIRYPLIVELSNQSIINNPFGMIIAGYYRQPTRIKTVK